MLSNKSDEDKEKLKYIFLFFIVFFISLLVPPFEKGTLDICVFKNLTNLPCPGCGLTRSFVYLAHGDITDSIRMNPFGIILFLAWGWVSLKDLSWIVLRKSLPFVSQKLWSRSKTLFVFGLLIFGVIRIFYHWDEFSPLHSLRNLVAMI
jgi:accessory gene regulator protein AgrB